jgi:hypothetical protein
MGVGHPMGFGHRETLRWGGSSAGHANVDLPHEDELRAHAGGRAYRSLEGSQVGSAGRDGPVGDLHCSAIPPGTTSSGGSFKPREANGPSVELPSKTIFSAGAGGELECGAAGKGATTGSLKIMGYEESELITVKNP